MLKIKLARFGRQHQPNYRIVVKEEHSKRDGKYLIQVGAYNPIQKTLSFEKDLYQEWLKKGAQPTQTVASLFVRSEKQTTTK